jgi:hypothetical protein
MNQGHSASDAAAHFQLNPSMVYRWLEQREVILSERGPGRRRIGSGRHTFYPDEEQTIKTWIHDQWNQGHPVCYREIMERMRTLIYPLNPHFKASHQWLYGFLRRHGLPFADKSEGLVVDSAWRGDEHMQMGRNLPRPRGRPRQQRRARAASPLTPQSDVQQQQAGASVQGLHEAFLSVLQDGTSSHLVTMDPTSSPSSSVVSQSE